MGKAVFSLGLMPMGTYLAPKFSCDRATANKTVNNRATGIYRAHRRFFRTNRWSRRLVGAIRSPQAYRHVGAIGFLRGLCARFPCYLGRVYLGLRCGRSRPRALPSPGRRTMACRCPHAFRGFSSGRSLDDALRDVDGTTPTERNLSNLSVSGKRRVIDLGALASPESWGRPPCLILRCHGRNLCCRFG